MQNIISAVFSKNILSHILKFDYENKEIKPMVYNLGYGLIGIDF